MSTRVTFACLIVLISLFQLAACQDPTEPEIDASCDSPCYWYPDVTVCHNGTCSCKDSKLTWYPQHYQCSLPVGSVCSYDDPSSTPCPQFAPCTKMDENTPPTCFNGLYGSCVHEADCSPGNSFACITGTCRCKNSISLEPGRVNSYTCLVKTESSGCSVDGVTGPKCSDPNAECVEPEGICKCKAGSMLIGGICEVSSLNQPCSLYDCGSGLSCKNNKCQCPDEKMVWNQETKACQIPVGDRCDTDDWYRVDLCAAGGKCLDDKVKRIKVCKCDKPTVFAQDPETGLMACL